MKSERWRELNPLDHMLPDRGVIMMLGERGSSRMSGSIPHPYIDQIRDPDFIFSLFRI
jgi:hypothetical protein